MHKGSLSQVTKVGVAFCTNNQTCGPTVTSTEIFREAKVSKEVVYFALIYLFSAPTCKPTGIP